MRARDKFFNRTCSDFVSFETKLRANFYPTFSAYCRTWNKVPSIVKIPISTWELDDHNHGYLTRFETYLSFAKMKPQRNFIFVSSHRISFTLFVSGNLNHPIYTYLFSLWQFVHNHLYTLYLKTYTDRIQKRIRNTDRWF